MLRDTRSFYATIISLLLFLLVLVLFFLLFLLLPPHILRFSSSSSIPPATSLAFTYLQVGILPLPLDLPIKGLRHHDND